MDRHLLNAPRRRNLGESANRKLQKRHVPTPLRWGILSTARIGLRRIIPALQRAEANATLAIASRDLARAREVARQLGIPRAYGSYEQLLVDRDIDAVYNPLPNSLHRLWTVRAAEAGKHVLCEKPLALDAMEAEAMVAACQRAGILLQEGFMYRFHPQIAETQRLVRDGAIGEPWLVRSAFTFSVSRPDDIRLNASLGGGGLMDVGCYCINISRLLLGEPTSVSGTGRDEHGVDVVFAGALQFADLATALFDCGVRAPGRQFCEIVGTEGVLMVARPFQPEEDPATITLKRGDRHDRIEIPGTNQYVRMIEAFAECVRNAKPPRFPPSEAIGNARVIDALRRSARTGTTAQVEAC